MQIQEVATISPCAALRATSDKNQLDSDKSRKTASPFPSMANCLRLAVASSISCPSSAAPPPQRRRTCASINSRNIPMPPMNPEDPFLSMLASVAASSPNTLLNKHQKYLPKKNKHQKSDTPPYLDMFDSPDPMATFDQVEESDPDIERRRRPRDLASCLFRRRTVYIGSPLVPAVTERVITELMYHQWTSPEPIYIYIDSTGPIGEDGEMYWMSTDGFAIYDIMMMLRNEIHTVAFGTAAGPACLLLAAGTKGKRYMMPYATAMIERPRIPSFGLMPADDVFGSVNEVSSHSDTFVKLFARHTGNSEEVVTNMMTDGLAMDPAQAIEFGVADEICPAAGTRKRMSWLGPR